MATHNTQSDEIRANETPPAVAENGVAASIAGNWPSALCYAGDGVTAVGLLLVVFGALLTPNDLLILIGTGVVCLGAIGWIILAILAIAGTVLRHPG